MNVNELLIQQLMISIEAQQLLQPQEKSRRSPGHGLQLVEELAI